MKPSAIEEAWSLLPPRDVLAAIAHRGPKPVFATISGAHLYGFASKDSDIDLRGAFLHPTAAMLGIDPPKETITVDADGDFELDWVAHDLRKLAKLLTQHNGYVLEQVFSPLVVVATDAFEELKALARGCITRPTVRHYLGFAKGRRKRLGEPDPTVKHLLYAYRVYLSGIHLMRSGDVEANLETLNDGFRLSSIGELVARKREGREKELLTDLARFVPELDELEATLVRAHDESRLPQEPTTRAALDAFVVRARLALASP